MCRRCLVLVEVPSVCISVVAARDRWVLFLALTPSCLDLEVVPQRQAAGTAGRSERADRPRLVADPRRPWCQRVYNALCRCRRLHASTFTTFATVQRAEGAGRRGAASCKMHEQWNGVARATETEPETETRRLNTETENNETDVTVQLKQSRTTARPKLRPRPRSKPRARL